MTTFITSFFFKLGLEYLASLEKLNIEQKVSLTEAIIGWEKVSLKQVEKRF
jgi:hypothetical protein